MRYALFLIFCANANSSELAVLLDTNCFQAPRIYSFQFSKLTKIQHSLQAFAVEGDESRVRHEPCVVEVSPNLKFHRASDPKRSEQIYLDAIEHVQGKEIFFNSSFALKKTATVGVIDSGIDRTHPDLLSRMWLGPNGTVGYNFVDDTTSPIDDSGHGSHVAGIIGAQPDNNLGIEGVAGLGVKLMALKALDEAGDGTVVDVVNAIRWGSDNGAEVLNMSLTAIGSSSVVENAIQYALSKNVVITVAAGNDGNEITSSNFVIPAAYAPMYTGLLSVGSTNATDSSRSPFSNYSPDFVKIAAPGQASPSGIISTYPGNEYGGEEGTSMASPQVAGAASLAIAFYKTHDVPYSLNSIQEAVTMSSTEDPQLQSSFANGRRLNLERLGRYLLNATVLTSSGGMDD